MTRKCYPCLDNLLNYLSVIHLSLSDLDLDLFPMFIYISRQDILINISSFQHIFELLKMTMPFIRDIVYSIIEREKANLSNELFLLLRGVITY